MEEIYKKYSKLVYNYLFSLTKNSDLSEELMQETFYSAIKGINTFKNECKLSVWLCQIAKNKLKNYALKHKKVKFVSLDDNRINNLIFDNYIEEILDNNEQTMELYKKIHKLDNTYKELFYLKIRGNLTFKQIGEIMGKNEQWARVTFYRIKQKLKEELKKDE